MTQEGSQGGLPGSDSIQAESQEGKELAGLRWQEAPLEQRGH